MPSVPIQKLRDDLQALYLPPFGKLATWKKMRQVLDEFATYAGVKKTSDLTPTAIASWIRDSPRPRSPATTFSLLSAFRRACSYSIQRGWLKVSPFRFRKLNDWVPGYLPGEEADDDDDEGDRTSRHHPLSDVKRAMLHLQAESAFGWENHRLFAVAATTFLTGARAMEVQAAKVADFNLTTRWFKIRVNERRGLKTRKSRRKVPLTRELVSILAAWLPLAGSVWAFPGIRKVGPWISGGSGRKPLDRLKAEASKAGVEGLTFLSLRHSFITHSAGAWGVPDLLSQQIAGHTRRETTDGYRGFDESNIFAAIDSISLGLLPPPKRTA